MAFIAVPGYQLAFIIETVSKDRSPVTTPLCQMMAMYYPRASPKMHVGELGVQLVDKQMGEAAAYRTRCLNFIHALPYWDLGGD